MIVDLFGGGAGGWELAAAALGLVVVGIEMDAGACLTRAAAGLLTIRADVATYPLERFAGKVTGITASPPCQSFSKAGKRAMLNDSRGQLVWEPLRWVEALRPEWCAFEQVPDVLPIWKLCRDRLRAIGYSAWCGVLDAADYGTPQNRDRAILMASRVSVASAPPPTHAERPATGFDGVTAELWLSMADALGWGMTERPYVTVAVGHHDAAGVGGSGARASVERERERERERAWLPRATAARPTSIRGDRRAPSFAPRRTGIESTGGGGRSGDPS